MKHRARFCVTILWVVALFAVGCGGKLDITSDDYKFTDLNTQTSDINTTLVDLQTQLTNLTNLNEEAHTALQNQINVLTADLEALKGRISANEEDIKDLKADADALAIRVDDVESRLAVLEAYIVKVNSPLFVSVVITETRVWNGHRWDSAQEYGATIVWTASAGGDTATSYNVYAVVVSDNGALGVPFLLANGTGSYYAWDGHVDNLPLGFDNGPNPQPLNSEQGDRCSPDVYRFAVTAVDENQNESAPSVTSPGEQLKVYPKIEQTETTLQ